MKEEGKYADRMFVVNCQREIQRSLGEKEAYKPFKTKLNLDYYRLLKRLNFGAPKKTWTTSKDASICSRRDMKSRKLA